jgi:quinol monooxygenase YgiN
MVRRGSPVRVRKRAWLNHHGLTGSSGSYLAEWRRNPTNKERVMAVLVRHRVSGMTPEQYDQSAPALIEKLKTQPGFLYHVAFVDEGGTFTVSEIWESKEQHDSWFSENVEGVIPGIEQQVIKVHAVITP